MTDVNHVEILSINCYNYNYYNYYYYYYYCKLLLYGLSFRMDHTRLWSIKSRLQSINCISLVGLFIMHERINSLSIHTRIYGSYRSQNLPTVRNQHRHQQELQYFHGHKRRQTPISIKVVLVNMMHDPFFKACGALWQTLLQPEVQPCSC